MKKAISILLTVLTVFSCFSCLAFAGSYNKFKYHKDPTTIQEGEYGFGVPNFDVDDNYKCIFYTEGSLKEIIKYGDAGAKILAPLTWVSILFITKLGVKVAQTRDKYSDYKVVELSNDEYYLGYIGEGNFIY